jgi:DNA topoisomerase-1
VNQGKVNATLPKELKPEDVTVEKALELLAAKGGPSATKKSSSRTAAAKKAPAKKATAKKTTTKPAAKTAKPKAASKSKAENPA